MSAKPLRRLPRIVAIVALLAMIALALSAALAPRAADAAVVETDNLGVHVESGCDGDEYGRLTVDNDTTGAVTFSVTGDESGTIPLAAGALDTRDFQLAFGESFDVTADTVDGTLLTEEGDCGPTQLATAAATCESEQCEPPGPPSFTLTPGCVGLTPVINYSASDNTDQGAYLYDLVVNGTLLHTVRVTPFGAAHGVVSGTTGDSLDLYAEDRPSTLLDTEDFPACRASVELRKVFTNLDGTLSDDDFSDVLYELTLLDGTAAAVTDSTPLLVIANPDAAMGSSTNGITQPTYTIFETADEGYEVVACDESVLSRYDADEQGVGTFDAPTVNIVHVVCNAEVEGVSVLDETEERDPVVVDDRVIANTGRNSLPIAIAAIVLLVLGIAVVIRSRGRTPR